MGARFSIYGLSVNNPIQWTEPFSDHFGNGMVYRQFAVGSTLYAVGFEQITTMDDLVRKGVNIRTAHPAFCFPASGVWGVIFDEINPNEMAFKGFQHVQHPGLSSSQVLWNVASIIYDHYTVCNAGAYVFSAAEDHQHLRTTDLTDIYCKLLGLNGKRKSRLFKEGFPGWNAYCDIPTGGRGYVVTTQSY
ncbi:hypothetical protein EF878_05775 [Dickeya undicola]|uniref:Uncharacterized protein n=1 Tax=Dickeya undicola TaxID=1577887 RepID=A0A3N0G4N4_9GAMM|nr:hypothetical protein EF878_05775 [Dickeya undicola]